MTIDEALILRIENLARLELSEQERTKITGDLNEILKMVEKLEELDTEGVQPLTYISEETNVFREDVVKNQVSQERGLANAPDKNESYFKVPKVIDLKKSKK